MSVQDDLDLYPGYRSHVRGDNKPIGQPMILVRITKDRLADAFAFRCCTMPCTSLIRTDHSGCYNKSLVVH